MRGSRVNPLAAAVRTLQIVIAAMAGGCLLFLAVVLAVRGGPVGFAEIPSFTLIVLGVAAAIVVARLFVPWLFVAQARRKIREGTWSFPKKGGAPANADPDNPKTIAQNLAQAFLARTVLAAAMLEGATFLVLIAYMLEQSPLSLGAAVVLIVALLAHIPSSSGVARWIQDQMKLLDEERMLSPSR